MRDPHSILGIPPNATLEEAKKAYRRLARKYHPDVSDEPNAEEKFKEVQAAYDAIKNPKPQYDEYQSPFGFGGFDDFLYRNFGMGAHTRPPIYHVQITLEEAYSGTSRVIHSIGSSPIQIPAGVRTGTQLYVNNQYIVVVDVLKHSKFSRNGDDLMVAVDLTMPQAILGCEVNLQHLSGKTICAKIPAGIQSGQVIRLQKQGMPNNRMPNHRGDLFIQARVLTPNPDNLTEDQKQSIMSLGYQKTKTI